MTLYYVNASSEDLRGRIWLRAIPIWKLKEIGSDGAYKLGEARYLTTDPSRSSRLVIVGGSGGISRENDIWSSGPRSCSRTSTVMKMAS